MEYSRYGLDVGGGGRVFHGELVCAVVRAGIRVWLDKRVGRQGVFCRGCTRGELGVVV